jgi:hypothetical protein
MYLNIKYIFVIKVVTARGQEEREVNYPAEAILQD